MKPSNSKKLLAALISVAFMAPMTFASANTATSLPQLTDDAEAEIRSFWTEYEVSEGIQDSLIMKLESTGYVDALTTADPSNTEDYEGLDKAWTVVTFPDGSIQVQEIEKPTVSNGGISPYSITGCTNQQGSGYSIFRNCLVKTGDGIRSLSFRADWANYNGGNAEILKTYNPYASSNYGSMTLPTRVMWRPKSTTTLKAVAKYSSAWAPNITPGGETIYTTLWLSRSGSATVGTS